MSDEPDAEVDPPLFLKALGAMIAVSFTAAAVAVARDALGKPFSPAPLFFVLLLVASASTFAGLLVWRTRLYAERDSVVVERRGYLGTTRRTFAAVEIDLSLERQATWGLLAKAVVPRFVMKTRDGEVLLSGQWVGVDRLAERLAKRIDRPLRET